MIANPLKTVSLQNMAGLRQSLDDEHPLSLNKKGTPARTTEVALSSKARKDPTTYRDIFRGHSKPISLHAQYSVADGEIRVPGGHRSHDVAMLEPPHPGGDAVHENNGAIRVDNGEHARAHTLQEVKQ